MGPILFAVFASALIGGTFCAWREVEAPRSLAVSGNYSGTLRVGDVVELTCTSAGVLPYSTLRWTSQEDNVQLSAWSRGRSPLSLALRVRPELHGVRFFCSALFTEAEEGHYFSYTVVSEVVQLSVEGAGAGAPWPPYRPGHVEMEAQGTEHRVGDIVPFSCSTYDIPYTVVDVIQAKGNYEVELHTGLQPWRQVRVTVSAADGGSALYCRATTSEPDDYRATYTLVSNRVPIHVIDKRSLTSTPPCTS